MKRKAILFSAPSGSGKTTIIKRLMTYFDCFEFSISATSRQPREGERNGVDYYFLTPEAFQQRIDNGDFLEWEEVYANTRYGTLKSEVDRICGNGKVMIFDVDVNGGINIKRYFGDDALAIFIMPPSIEVLEQRLRSRGTETEESLQKRLGRSSKELKEAHRFDVTIVNDDLQRAVEETRQTIEKYLEN
ncbi:MAG: guanylate kinase [Bacteroidales bacterium]|nr:guanylate kinase [Bacteroidales bacterium]MCR5191859.1 guanylate kinase [Bacteroidales bacterium]